MKKEDKMKYTASDLSNLLLRLFVRRHLGKIEGWEPKGLGGELPLSWVGELELAPVVSGTINNVRR